MREDIRNRYFTYRAEQPWLPAKTALRWAREYKEPRFRLANGRTMFAEDEFRFYLQQEDSEDSYEDGGAAGGFSRKPKPGAVPIRERSRFDEMWKTVNWFAPGITYKEHYSGLRQTCTRGEADYLARKYVHEDLKRALSFGEEWHWTFLHVIVRHATTSIILAETSLGGVESDSNADYVSDVFEDLVEEARTEALATLAKIRAGSPGEASAGANP